MKLTKCLQLCSTETNTYLALFNSKIREELKQVFPVNHAYNKNVFFFSPQKQAHVAGAAVIPLQN